MRTKSIIPCTCPVCGTPFTREPNQLRRSPTAYCSQACQYEGRKQIAPLRFWTHVEKSDGCWTKRGKNSPRGYWFARHNGKSISAHRLAWELAAGPVPDGFIVCHTCDNPACVRNDDAGWYEVNGILRPRRGHLFLGTVSDNAQDRNAKGRAGRRPPDCFARGERAGSAKLTAPQVLEIRRKRAEGVKLLTLAAEYGVGRDTIWEVVKRRTWSHI